MVFIDEFVTLKYFLALNRLEFKLNRKYMHTLYMYLKKKRGLDGCLVVCSNTARASCTQLH